MLCKSLTSRDLSSTTQLLRILDVAAGNGRLGVEIRNQLPAHKIERLDATDLSEHARLATLRNREQDLYDEYVVANLLQKPHSGPVQKWKTDQFNIVTVCAALGPSQTDLPIEVIDAVIDFLQDGGLLAFTVNAKGGCEMSERYTNFLATLGQDSGDTHWGSMKEVERITYEHRLDIKGRPIMYTAFVYRKTGTTDLL